MTLSLTQPKNLALYHYDSCPFCAKTRRAIDKLGLEIELKNIQTNHQHRIDLQHGGHKTQVPCLRIEQAKGDTQWLYESDDIINFLAKQQNELFNLALTA
ncbi:glutaredoxin [Colwellia sp. 75C3]|uniref:glutaredoxin family protein n=1 Tax=Colwellia sp. 75C3 TaxID=888425 RepID=UPI000C347B10|nr:glutathione S-transferase N-terminal domain-containing protein [Colwellia sp. 75C3]PKG82351.1 glutaredoxin [Colwellia sp. 75C3]